MEILRLNKENYYQIFMQTVQALREGKVVAVPTDTVYGLSVDATNDEAVRRLFETKKRDEGKPVPVFVDTMERAKQIAFIEEKKLEDELAAKWPGAFTAVLYARNIVSSLARGRGGLTVGVRIPDYAFVRDLVRAFGQPITGTSANFSGQKPATRAEEIQRADLVVDGGVCDGAPSTVVDFTVVPLKILRP